MEADETLGSDLQIRKTKEIADGACMQFFQGRLGSLFSRAETRAETQKCKNPNATHRLLLITRKTRSLFGNERTTARNYQKRTIETRTTTDYSTKEIPPASIQQQQQSPSTRTIHKTKTDRLDIPPRFSQIPGWIRVPELTRSA
jgi:hypothetical protein